MLADEYVMLALRTADGIDLELLEARYGVDLLDEKLNEIAWLEEAGHIAPRSGRRRAAHANRPHRVRLGGRTAGQLLTFFLVSAIGAAACGEPPQPQVATDIEFRGDGVLDFLRSDSTVITRIAIEIAATRLSSGARTDGTAQPS